MDNNVKGTPSASGNLSPVRDRSGSIAGLSTDGTTTVFNTDGTPNTHPVAPVEVAGLGANSEAVTDGLKDGLATDTTKINTGQSAH